MGVALFGRDVEAGFAGCADGSGSGVRVGVDTCVE